MASQAYCTRSHRASSDTQSEDYSERNFLNSFPDEHATISQVVIWIESGDKSSYASSDPDWLSYCNFDGYSINNFSLNELLGSLVGWGLEVGSAEWLVERIVFARGVSPSSPLLKDRFR
jgi:hypothetical protein